MEAQDRKVPQRRLQGLRLPPLTRVLFGCLLLTLLSATGVSLRAEVPLPWGGSVLDLLGQGIPGVEVLVYPAGRGSSGPFLGTFRTDEKGRFRLSGLAPGHYFLALNKPGYQILMAQVNTRLLSRLTLTLIPGSPESLPLAGEKTGPMDWVLRSPRSDVLKEMGSKALAEGGETTGSMSLAKLPFTGELRQWFTSGYPLSGDGSDAIGSSGRSTALDVSGDLYGRGDWRLRGLAESLTTDAGPQDPGGAEKDQGADRLRVALKYDLSPGDAVRFQARYDRDRYRAGVFGSPEIPGNQEVRTLGYQADWIRTLGKEDGWEMNFGFLQADGRIPDGFDGTVALMGPGEEALLQDRRWNAGALYGFNASPDHHVSVKARTRLYRYDQRDDGWVLAPVQPALSTAEAGERGWSVTVSGEDAWKLSDPLCLTLGLDYHRADSSGGFSTLVPRVGAKREGKRYLVQGTVLFQVTSLAALYNGDLSDSRTGSSGDSTLGLQAEVLQRIGGTWTLGGHVARNPRWVEPESALQEATGSADSVALFLKDPTATTQEIGFQIRKQLKGVEGSMEADQGRVVGRVAARLDDAPIQILGEGEIRYLALKAAALVERTATELRLDYRRLSGSEASSSRVDLTLLQEIPALARRGPVDWRVLLAYQTLIRDEGATPAGSAEPLERIRRVSGGIGVRF